MQHMKFTSGYKIPVLGLGTWGLRGHACKQAVKEALSLEYTHIDTAWMYENQGAVGDALKEAGADRGRLFITSKVWRTDLHYDGVLAQCEETLRDLKTAYVDLFLIHWPSEMVPMAETFKALKRLFEERKVRSVGVSNFTVAHLEEAQSVSEVPISVNQIKYHPGEEKRDVLRWCREHNVVVTAHTPLGKGRILGEPALINIGQCHGKTPGQVGLRWLVQQGMVVIPKASSEGHLKENMDVFDWSLSGEEMEQVSRLSARIREVNAFVDLKNLSDREIQGMLRELNTRDLAIALNGASQPVQNRIFQNLSERVADLIRDEIGSLGTVREQDVQVVRGRIVEIAREKLD